ncbi:CaiB/BaiF CoA transferase family protein [Rhodoligotrophos ferricapiens]|uniref:CaiB/BaiF CoA transferase family protein n=1 Tax=Rhodoligotrophos ferricapiens TaxID=3069264 RepID=UPI00315D9031
MSEMPQNLPLDGVTVLAVEQYGAGPFGTMLLGDLGAEVIKIENPHNGGDVGRHVGPYYFSELDSHFYQSFNRNKRSLTLDLKHPEGMKLFHELVRNADAVLDNLRGDLPDKLGLTYRALGEINPKVVCCHLSAYGREGERRAWPGYDYLMQAEAGYLSVTGEPDGPPTRMGLSIVDMMTGLMAGFALVSGIVGARSTGRGMDLDVSLFDTALHNLTYLATWYLNAGHVQAREPRSSHPSLTPSQLYRTKDGWLFVMCNKEKFWPIFAERIGRPDLATDERFATFAARLKSRAELTELLDATLATKTSAEWTAILGGHVPIAPVLDIGEALENPFVTEHGRLAEFKRPEGGEPVRMLAGPIRVNGNPAPAKAAPAMGFDTDALLSRLGYDQDTISAMRRKGFI